jgi:hypothetical protein
MRKGSFPPRIWLGDLFTADTLFGGGLLRPEAGIAVVVPS